MNLKLAWRNIWRNKRRTFITTASIFTAVFLAIIMRSAQLGTYELIISNMVSIYTGHIEVHEKGYFNDQTIDNSFEANDTLVAVLNKSKAIACWSPRLESFALASANELSEGVMVVGIDPEVENKLTHLAHKIIAGSYLKPGDSGIIIGQGIAEYLNIHVNDTMVLLGQGYHGSSAAGKYAVRGILKFPTPQLNQSMTFITIPQAQYLYGTGNSLTSIAVFTKPRADVSKVAEQLRNHLGNSDFEVLTWRQMLPGMLQYIALDNMFGIVIIVILYMIVAFGIFGTILMMLSERQHEFGILVAVGMKKTRLAWVVVLEIFMISCIGVLAGALAGIPLMEYFHLNPIKLQGAATMYAKFGMEPVMPFSNSPLIYLSQSVAIFCISLILMLYPLWRLLNLKTIRALKS